MFLSYTDLYFNFLKCCSFPTPLGVNLLWNIGFVLIVLSMIQLISGVYLSFYLNLGMKSCIFSKLFILKEVYLGWVNSLLHAMLPSFIFVGIYLHMLVKGFLFPLISYFKVWISGFILYLVYCGTSFTGYCVVGGSMSYWALVVVKNMMSFSLGEYTSGLLLFEDFNDSVLSKIFSYHFILGFSVVFLMILHMNMLHTGGSSNGIFMGVSGDLSFQSFMLVSDFLLDEFALLTLSLVFGGLLDYFYCVDMFSLMNEVKVPDSISPEWYLSVFFIALKSVSGKLVGMLLMGLVGVVVLMSPFNKNCLGGYSMDEGFVFFLILFFWVMLGTHMQFYGNSLNSMVMVFFIEVVLMGVDLDLLLNVSSFMTPLEAVEYTELEEDSTNSQCLS